MSRREFHRYVRDRWYRSVGGEWLRVVQLHRGDTSPDQRVSHLGCDFCFLHQTHTVAVCEFARSRGGS